jgi:ABC-type multidrug transport system permease subunit
MRTDPPRDLVRPTRAFDGTGAFLWTEVLVQAHESLAMATAMVTQTVLLVFVYILNPGLIGVALIGATLFSAFALGQRVLNEAAYIRIDHKANDMYLAGPMSPEGYFLGMAAGILVVYIAPIALLGTLAVVVGHLAVTTSLALLGLAGLVWLFAASIGYIMSTFFRDNRAIWAYASLFFNVFGVLPPVFYPFDYFPAALQPVALLMPPSAAAALLQWRIGVTALSTGQAELAALGLIVETAVVFVVAVFWARRTVRGP